MPESMLTCKCTGMTKLSLRMITPTEWWRQKNFLSGSWSNLASRFLSEITTLSVINISWCFRWSLSNFAVFHAENFVPAFSQQIWFIWKEGSQSKYVELIGPMQGTTSMKLEFILCVCACVQVPLNVCGWYKDYQPVSTGKQEIEHAYE